MKVIIIGSQGHAKVVIDAIRKADKHSILGLIDDFREVGDTTLGIPVIGKISDIEGIEGVEKHNFFIAVGDNVSRFRISKKIEHLKPNYINVIHPDAVIGGSQLMGHGNFIAAGAVISPSNIIGNHCIINTGAQIDHDNTIGDFVSLAPKAATAGNVFIQEGCYIGMGAVIIEKKVIGKHTVIGAGSVVITDIHKNKVAYGNPCKEIKTRELSETFMSY